MSSTQPQVAELAVLLPAAQFVALSIRAEERGLTTGELLRYMIAGFLDAVEESREPPSA